MTVAIANGNVKIRVPTRGLHSRDTFTLSGRFTSAAGAERNGPIYLKMTGNLLAADLPI